MRCENEAIYTASFLHPQRSTNNISWLVKNLNHSKDDPFSYSLYKIFTLIFRSNFRKIRKLLIEIFVEINMTVGLHCIRVKFLLEKRPLLLWPTNDFKAPILFTHRQEKRRENNDSKKSSIKDPLMKHLYHWKNGLLM